MSWFSKDHRHKVSAAEIAESLFRVMVQEESQSSNAGEFDVPETLWPEFYAKMRLYHEATVFMLLITTAEQEPKYKNVLATFESLILPTQPTYEGVMKTASA